MTRKGYLSITLICLPIGGFLCSAFGMNTGDVSSTVFVMIFTSVLHFFFMPNKEPTE